MRGLLGLVCLVFDLFSSFLFRTNKRLEGWHNETGRGMESHSAFHHILEAFRNEVHRMRRLVMQVEDGVENVQLETEFN